MPKSWSDNAPTPKVLTEHAHLKDPILYKIKRTLLGNPLNRHTLSHQRLKKRYALGVLSSDCISSSAYGSEQILLALVPAFGLAAFAMLMPMTAIVLVIFSGAHTYISSSWYDHENVPTWNYLAVHVYGKVKLHSLEESIEALKRLVNKYEAKSEKPVRIEDLSKKTMLQACGIVSFEIEITAVEAKKKLSQNRDDKNYQTIISKLENSNDNQAIAVAEEMKKNRKL